MVGQFEAVMRRRKALFCYSSRYSKIIGETQKIYEAFFVFFMCVPSFKPFWGICLIFDHFWAVTKRNKVLLCHSPRYSKFSGAS